MNSDKLNDIIKKKSKGNNNLAHHFHQMFFFEHVLMRLENSKYRDNIILKRVFTDYQQKLEYAKVVSFDDTINAIKELVNILNQELVEV